MFLCIFTDHIERYADGNYMVFIWEHTGVSNQFDSYISILLNMVPVIGSAESGGTFAWHNLFDPL